MNMNDTTRLRNRLQQIIDEAQSSPDRTVRSRNKVRTEARIHDSGIVHCDAFTQPVSFR